MPLFFYFFSLLSIILLLKYLLFWAYLWQLKEYRMDRMRDFLFSPEGRKILFSKNYLFKIALIFLALALFFMLLIWSQKKVIIDFCLFSLGLLIAVLIIFEAVWFILKIFQKRIILPIWTGRAKLTVFLTFLLIFTILIFPILLGGRQVSQFPNFPISQFFFLTLIMIILAPLLVSLAVVITMPFAVAVKFYICRQAKRRRQKFQDLIVIGITGSYGKTSVKEFIAQILSHKFKVLKTEKNINTEIGIAQTIIKELTAKHQIFICEMGAYRRGEIKKSGSIAQPQIAVITGICEQHLSLFGSLENIIRAKSEIISCLTPQLIGGVTKTPQLIGELNLVFLNYDSKNVRQVKVPSCCQKITYGIKSSSADVRAKLVDGQWILSVNKEIGKLGNWEIGKLLARPPELRAGQIGDGNLPNKVGLEIRNLKLEIGNLLGKHNVLNLLPAVAIALQLGMNKQEINYAVENIKPPAGTLQMIKKDNLILIDDTYNANPAGVKAALEVLADFNIVEMTRRVVSTGRVVSVEKILVLDDILELGHKAKKIHQDIGEQISKIKLQKIILVGKNYAEFLRKILLARAVKDHQVIIYRQAKNIKDIIGNQKAVILFEGRRAKNVLDLICKPSSKFLE